MRYRWQLVVVMALALGAFGGNNNSGTEQPVAQAISTTATVQPTTTTEPTQSGQEKTYKVVEGDNLWTIAGDHLAEARSGGAGEPTTREVAAYWLRVVDANAPNLRSGDPDLIYPGETVVLPPID
jgi:nucleoid-associated protein YgaU